MKGVADKVKKRIINTLANYLIIVMCVTIVVISYVSFESIGLNIVANILLQSLLITIVNWRFEKTK